MIHWIITNLLYIIHYTQTSLLYTIHWILQSQNYSTQSLHTKSLWRSKQTYWSHARQRAHQHTFYKHITTHLTAHKYWDHYNSIPAVIQSGLCARSNSIPSAFNVTDLLEIYRDNFLNELVLESNLDFSHHLVHNAINLSENHIFTNVAKFRHVVATNKTHVLHLLAHMIDYNVTAQDKML